MTILHTQSSQKHAESRNVEAAHTSGAVEGSMNLQRAQSECRRSLKARASTL